MRNHWKPLVVLTLVLVGLGAAAGGLLIIRTRMERQAQTLLTRADALFRQAISIPIRRSDPKALERLEGPIKTYREIMERFPKTKSAEEAAIRLGNLYYQLERYDEALSTFTDYLNRYPKGRFGFLARLGAGYCYEEKGDFEKASHAYQAALESTSADPLLPEAYLAFARVQTALGRVEEARRFFQKVVEQWPRTTWAEMAKSQLASLDDKKPYVN